MRSLTCDLLRLDFEDLIKNPDKMIVKYKKRAGAVIEDIDILGREIAGRLLEGRKIDGSVDTGGLYQIRGYEDNKDLEAIRSRILDLNERIEKSTEMENLMKAGNGGNVETGPSGVVTRGRDDVIPTGRNFYTLDPGTIPTRAAWVIGQ